MRGCAAPLLRSCGRRPVTPRPGQPSGHSAAGSRGSGLSRRLVPPPADGAFCRFCGRFCPCGGPFAAQPFRLPAAEVSAGRLGRRARSKQKRRPGRPGGAQKPSPRCPRGPCRWWMRSAWSSSMLPLRAATFHGIQVGAIILFQSALLSRAAALPFLPALDAAAVSIPLPPGTAGGAGRAVAAAAPLPAPGPVPHCQRRSQSQQADQDKIDQMHSVLLPRALKSPAAAPPGRRRTPPPRPPRSGKRRVPRPPDGSPAPA